ncbi:hypothetical protein T07_1292 [Trichinella nelsoni]|uniref:Uncharacterized protein n=1 Tax=Trichinella nelsoni TaxID=6336 RepID=A0A0V0RYB4_9BILA|nr:hypothetical protein T07_1292 [Trichinella nelsoni]
MCKHATNISFSNITEYKIILIAVFTVHRKTWNTFTADGFAIRQKRTNFCKFFTANNASFLTILQRIIDERIHEQIAQFDWSILISGPAFKLAKPLFMNKSIIFDVDVGLLVVQCFNVSLIDEKVTSILKRWKLKIIFSLIYATHAEAPLFVFSDLSLVVDLCYIAVRPNLDKLNA